MARFSVGDRVGELALDLFPAGVMVPYIENDHAAQLKQTNPPLLLALEQENSHNCSNS